MAMAWLTTRPQFCSVFVCSAPRALGSQYSPRYGQSESRWFGRYRHEEAESGQVVNLVRRAGAHDGDRPGHDGCAEESVASNTVHHSHIHFDTRPCGVRSFRWELAKR